MWTKLSKPSSNYKDVALEAELVSQHISALLQGKDISDVSLLSRGTQNFTYVLRFQTEKKVVRIFGKGASAAIAAREEFQILHQIYGAKLNLELLPELGQGFHGLLMDQLDEDVNIDADTALQISTKILEQLNSFREPIKLDKSRNIEKLIQKAELKVRKMDDSQIIDGDTSSLLIEAFGKLTSYLAGMTLLQCHGDLGPRNILLSSDGRPIVIDWEDRLWSFKNYDYLYWLTFFENRSLVSRENLIKSGHPLEICQATMAAIVVLKESIFISEGLEIQGRQSAQDRIRMLFTAI